MSLKIQITKRHQGISAIKLHNVFPKFAILTGRNGSGKSTFFEGVEKGSFVAIADGKQINQNSIQLLNTNGLYENLDSPNHRPLAPDKELDSLWQVILSIRKVILQDFDHKHIQNPSSPEYVDANTRIRIAVQREFGNTHSKLEGAQALRGAAWDRRSKPINSLREDFDFVSATPESLEPAWRHSLQGVDFLRQPLTNWFQRYADMVKIHLHLKADDWLNGSGQPEIEQFIQDYGEQPWKIVNRLFEKASVPAQIDHPPIGKPDKDYSPSITHTVSGANFATDLLSSGERLLLSLLPKLMMKDERLVRFPNLLLLDEVDSTLHPSLTELLLDTIIDLVKEQDCHVLMTTHSPSTISIASERLGQDSIFEIKPPSKSGDPHQIEKVTPGKAIHGLTRGLITVTQDTRFVIVEASTDELVYTSLYDTMVGERKLPNYPNLVFLRASDKEKGDGNGGGKGQVKQWVNKLVEHRENFFGLLDFDYGGNESSSISTLDQYHSLECILLDPVVIFAQLLHNKEHERINLAGLPRDEFRIDHNVSQLDELSNTELQLIVDAIIGTIGPETDARIQRETEKDKCPLTVKELNEIKTINYRNGKKVNVPSWVVRFRGHDRHEVVKAVLDQKVKAQDPSKKHLFNNLTDLGELLAKNIPGFVPKSLETKLESLISK